MLKDLIGLDPLFEDDAANFFLVSEDDSILLRHTDDVVDTSPDKCPTQIHRINRQPEEPAHRDTADSVH